MTLGFLNLSAAFAIGADRNELRQQAICLLEQPRKRTLFSKHKIDGAKESSMSKKLTWDEDKIARLRDLIEKKVSLARAAVVLKCSQSSVQIQARRLGAPFPGVRKQKAVLRANIAEAEARAGIRR